MALNAGDRLGPYEIVSLLGKGGMGEVYRARDPRLNRDVAIKVSAYQFSERFAREAQAIAKLNHPNICTLYDVGPNYLVMELVEGSSPKGPLPEAALLDYARQMAAALDEAHENGVTHRDLKPGNIIVRPDGVLKILDFGLAKIQDAAPTPDPSEAETISAGMTAMGAIVGTPAYMSPEQARGKKIDKRTDIWAFGVILYELTTGERLFGGDTMTDVIAQVVTKEIDVSRLPEPIRSLVARCLERDPKRRLRDLGDAAFQATPAVAPRTRWLWPTLAAASALAAVAAFTIRAPQSSGPPPVVRFEIPPVNDSGWVNAPYLSPNGKLIALSDGVGRSFLRSLDSQDVRPGPNVGPNFAPAGHIFWKPDSTELAFNNAASALQRWDMTSPPRDIVRDIGGAFNGSWNRDGVILFSRGNPMEVYSISAAGGDARQLTHLDIQHGEQSHRFAEFLPDGKHFVYYVFRADFSKNSVELRELGSSEHRTLLENSSMAIPAAGPDGTYLMYLKDGVLLAQRLDVDRATLTGDPVALASGVSGTSLGNSRPNFSVSATGVLAYRTGLNGTTGEMVWVDRAGKVLEDLGLIGVSAKLSPDGRRVAASRGNAPRDMWVRDLATKAETRVTFGKGGEQRYDAVWSPDGKRLACRFAVVGQVEIGIKNADGTGDEKIAFRDASLNTLIAWTPDGKSILASFTSVPTLRLVPVSGGPPAPVGPADQALGTSALSPDGQWLAYTAGNDMFVEPIRSGGGRWQVTHGGQAGNYPEWGLDGKELFYQDRGRLVAVKVRTSPAVSVGQEELLFPLGQVQFRNLFIPAGDKFMIPRGTAPGESKVYVLLNWPSLLKK